MGLLDYADLAREKLKGLLGGMPIVQIAQGRAEMPTMGGLLGALRGMPIGPDPQGAYDAAIAMGPLVAGMTKWERAHKVAQKNAAKMLGLPNDNTAMDRAKALGFDYNLFHETSAARVPGIYKEGFNVTNPKAALGDDETPYAVFLKNHGKSIGLGGDAEVQIPVVVRGGKTEFFTTRGEMTDSLAARNPELRDMWRANRAADSSGAAEIDRLGEMMGRRGEPAKNGMTNAEIWRQISAVADRPGPRAEEAKRAITNAFRAGGTDIVGLLRDAGSMGRNVHTTMVLNPALIRSRFAAFDPARINENDLLAAYFGFPMYQGNE